MCFLASVPNPILAELLEDQLATSLMLESHRGTGLHFGYNVMLSHVMMIAVKELASWLQTASEGCGQMGHSIIQIKMLAKRQENRQYE